MNRSLGYYCQRHFLSGRPVLYSRLAGFTSLLEVGQLEATKQSGTYPTGQMFLHRLYGYRGVILYPWMARVYDRDVYKRQGIQSTGENTCEDPDSVTHTFYKVLMDERDWPLVRAQTEAVTVIGDLDSSRSLYALPGLDDAAHQDILPYKPNSDSDPLQHELRDKFLVFNPDCDPAFSPRATLQVWEKKSRPWLELSEVYKETTEGVRVTVIPFYMGCRNCLTHWWRYHVTLENLGELSVTLKDRMWCMFGLTGGLPETERGRGVGGQEPVLSRRLPAFQYTGHVSLATPNGHMWGYFRMEREDGYNFVCRSPWFPLESKRNKNDPSGPWDD